MGRLPTVQSMRERPPEKLIKEKEKAKGKEQPRKTKR